MERPNLSVVVAAFNAEKTIAQTIEAIQNQKGSGPLEAIVVDDGSTDKTSEIVKSYKEVRYVFQKNSGPASARNRGFKESKGELVFFTDSDCLPDPTWTVKILPHFSDPQVGVVAGSYGISNPESILARCIHKEIIYRHEKRMPNFPKSFGSYNFCVRREVFEKVGGFDENYRCPSGEDNDLSYKILKAKFKIFFAKDAIVHHYHPTNVLKYLKEQYRHGFWRAKMYIDHPGMSKGDDYTFWKDIFEPFFVLLILLTGFLYVWDRSIVSALAITSFILLGMEVVFAFQVTKSLSERIFFIFVMLARAFARTFGFLLGFPAFLVKIFLKKVK